MKKRCKTIVALLAIAGCATAQELTVQSSGTELVVNASGLTGMSALQFNLELPDGVTIADDATMGTATNGHTLSVQTLDNGDRLFILYSMDLNTFKNGELLRIPVNMDNYTAEDIAKLYKVRFSSAEAVSHTGADVEFNPTGIGTLTSVRTTDEGAIYDLNGRRLTEKPKSGYYIQGGKKYFVEK